MLPYWVTVFAKVNVYLRISKNIITTVKWRTFTGKLIAIAKRRSIQPNQLIIRLPLVMPLTILGQRTLPAFKPLPSPNLKHLKNCNPASEVTGLMK